MGLLHFITGLLHDDTVEVEYIKERSSMNDTLIFTGEPDYTSVISNGMSDGSGTPISPRIIQQMANDDARLNASHPVPGQRPARGRGVGVNTQQMPPAPPNAMPPNYGQQPPYGQLAPGYAPPCPPAQAQPGAVPPPAYQQPVQPVQQVQPPPSQSPLNFLQEPFSEMVMTDTECHLFIDLPGMTKDDIELDLTDNNDIKVTFTRKTRVSVMSAQAKPVAKKTGKKKKDDSKWVAQVNIPEYLLGTHTVVYNIMKPFDEDNIDCKFELGQLHITLKFRTPLSGRKITIG